MPTKQIAADNAGCAASYKRRIVVSQNLTQCDNDARTWQLDDTIQITYGFHMNYRHPFHDDMDMYIFCLFVGAS